MSQNPTPLSPEQESWLERYERLKQAFCADILKKPQCSPSELVHLAQEWKAKQDNKPAQRVLYCLFERWHKSDLVARMRARGGIEHVGILSALVASHKCTRWQAERMAEALMKASEAIPRSIFSSTTKTDEPVDVAARLAAAAPELFEGAGALEECYNAIRLTSFGMGVQAVTTLLLEQMLQHPGRGLSQRQLEYMCQQMNEWCEGQGKEVQKYIDAYKSKHG